MKRIVFFIFPALISIFLLYGCYESAVPLQEKPSLRVDTRLIGNWISISNDKKEETIFLILRKFSAHEYLVAWKEKKDRHAVIARGYSSRVANIDIINLQNIDSLDDKDRTFVFFKYRIAGNGNLVANILSNDYPGLKDKKFRSPEKFRTFIKNNLSQKDLFGEDIVFKATKESPF
jgi:hypothetical protein